MTRRTAVRYGRPRVCDYWCQLLVRVPESEAEWFLGGALVPTPRLAVRWLRGQAERVSGALRPDPLASPYPRVCPRSVPAEGGAEVWPIDPAHWENTCRIERMLAALLVGEPVVVVHTVADRFAGRGDVRVRYEFSARPVPARTSAYAGAAVGTLGLVQPSVNAKKSRSASDLSPLPWRRRLATTVSRWSTVLLILLLVFGTSGPAAATTTSSPGTTTFSKTRTGGRGRGGRPGHGLREHGA